MPLVEMIALDQTLFALYINAAFCVFTEVLQRRSLGAALNKAKATALPCLFAGWRFWPVAHALTYSIVPLHMRVLWVDILEIIWVSILTTLVAAPPLPASHTAVGAESLLRSADSLDGSGKHSAGEGK